MRLMIASQLGCHRSNVKATGEQAFYPSQYLEASPAPFPFPPSLSSSFSHLLSSLLCPSPTLRSRPLKFS